MNPRTTNASSSDRWNRTHLFGAGVGTSCAAAVVGVVGVGPAARWAFGPPYGYGSDSTSRQAFWYAAIVLAATLGITLAVTAGLMARRGTVSWRDALWMANPLTIGCAFFPLLVVLDGAMVADGQVTYEYIGPAMSALQMALAVPVYASAIRFGAWAGAAARADH